MTEKPILMSAPMVRAILDGRKTETRRIINPQPTPTGGGYIYNGLFDSDELFIKLRCPYGIIGSHLWVWETFARLHDGLLQHLDPEPDNGEPFNNGWSTAFRADGEPANWEHYGQHWKPSIFMPRKLSRITLEITSVRVERLQDIFEADAKAEGVRLNSMTHWATEARDAFKTLWEEINGIKSWKQNPYVWVLEFKRIIP